MWCDPLTAALTHAEAMGLLFRILEDIGVIMDENARLLSIRSASRNGHFDFGLNRNRLELSRSQL